MTYIRQTDNPDRREQWIDVYEQLPKIGNEIEILCSDSPYEENGKIRGTTKIVGTPKLGEEWPIPDPRNGGTVYLRFWRFLQ